MQTLHAHDNSTLAAAVTALEAGEVVVLPTDTVYGLAAMPGHPDAVSRIFQAKARPAQAHLPVLAASVDQVRHLGVAFSPAADALAVRWWPGPLTLVFGFEAGADRPPWLDGRDEVAVRVPAHPFVLAVLERTGVLLVTSANQHGAATPPSAEEASQDLAPHVNLIVDGGTLDTTPSTLVNVHGAQAAVEREGAIASRDIDAALAGLP